MMRTSVSESLSCKPSNAQTARRKGDQGTQTVRWELSVVATFSLLALAVFSNSQYVYAGDSSSSVVAHSGQVVGTIQYCGSGGSAGVLVYIPGESTMATTGQSGTFRFLIVPAGSYTLRIEPPDQPPVVFSPVVVAKNEITDLGTIEICPDNDNDGYTANLDCNDNNASVYPGAEEGCDGFDNNCDAVVDEGCLTCTDEDRDSFFAQAGCDTDVDCNDDDPFTNPGANEICGNGVDDDCDGAIDGGCPDDMDGDGFPGDADCDDENPNVFPGAVEECNDVDDDCNGVIDLISQSCYSGPASTLGIGQCASGSSTCEIGVWTSCSGEVRPSTETCDGIDNDCDGMVDEDTGIGYCDSGLYGVCAGGMWSCSDGSLTCEVIRQPSSEICDGLDNDCDGDVDEGCLIDLDEDGWISSVDCNDFDASIYPGAPDVAYDGVDSNCDGID